jgi:hypothetical protein
MTQTAVSIADLNLKTKCEKGFEFEYIDEHENQTGIFLTVIGSASEKIRKASYAAHDRDARKAAMDKKRGRDTEVKPLEEWAEENMALTAMRVIAWRGISEPCTPENVVALLQSNDILLKQVIEKSDNVANFTKSKSNSSSNSQDTNSN